MWISNSLHIYEWLPTVQCLIQGTICSVSCTKFWVNVYQWLLLIMRIDIEFRLSTCKTVVWTHRQTSIKCCFNIKVSSKWNCFTTHLLCSFSQHEGNCSETDGQQNRYNGLLLWINMHTSSRRITGSFIIIRRDMEHWGKKTIVTFWCWFWPSLHNCLSRWTESEVYNALSVQE